MEYRNNHTTSTKCQYQAAHSNPTMCLFDALMFMKRANEMVKKMDPMITWSPWKPVAIKNVDPKEESDMQNGASIYSNA